MQNLLKSLLLFFKAGDVEEFKINFTTSLAITTAAFAHIVVGLYFYYIDVAPMVYLNCIGALACGIAYLLKRRDMHEKSFQLVNFDIFIYIIISMFFVGSNVYVQFFAFVSLIMQFTVFNYSMRTKIIYCFLTFFVLNFALSIEFWFDPLYPQPDNSILTFINLNLLLIGFILIMTLNEIVKKIIDAEQLSDMERLKKLTHIDPLTGLKNRRYAETFFNKILNKELNFEKYFFALLDIDSFKKINDTHGHAQGDAVLVDLASILTKAFRQMDLVCRWGGEEFLVVLCGCDKEMGARLLETVRISVMNSQVHLETGEVKYTITAGTSVFENNDITLTIENCDEKLYKGKQSGKNVIVID